VRKPISTGAFVGLAGFGLAIVGLVLPYLVKTMPVEVSIPLVVIGGLMIVAPGVMWLFNRDGHRAHDLRGLLHEGHLLRGTIDAWADPDEKRPSTEDPVYAWTLRTWEALRRERPALAQRFFGNATPYLPGLLTTAYGCELAEMGRRRYLDDRLVILASAVEPQETGTRDREEIGPKHRARLEGTLARFGNSIARGTACVYGEDHDRRAIAAHYPKLMAALAEWDAAVANEHRVLGPLRDLIRKEAEDRGLPEGPLKRIVDRLTRTTVDLNGSVGYKLRLTTFEEGPIAPPTRPADRTRVEIGHDHLLTIESTSRERVEEVRSALQDVFRVAQESDEARAIVDARETREALAAPVRQDLDLHAAIHPVLVAEGCPFCEMQRQRPYADGVA
jgi:hypothetical protein